MNKGTLNGGWTEIGSAVKNFHKKSTYNSPKYN